MEKPIVNILPDGGMFSQLRSGIRKNCSYHYLTLYWRAVRQENEKLSGSEGRSKTADDTIVYIGNPKEATKNAVITNK